MGRRRRALAGAILVASIAAGVGVPAPARGASTIYVTTLGDTSANDGFCTLREAIQSANTDTGVGSCISGGGFDTIIASVTGTIQLTADLPQVTSSMTIDGQGQITIDGQDAYQPITVNSGSLSLVNLTIRDGRGSVAGGIRFGGAIANGATFFGSNLTLTSNSADVGGAIYNNSASFTLIRSTVNGNTASIGAGIYMAAYGVLGNVTVQGNTASSSGAGIYTDADVNFRHLTVVGNTAPAGAGIEHEGGLLSLLNSIVLGNSGGNIRNLAGTQNIGATLSSGSAGGIVDTVLRDNGGPTKTLLLLKTATPALGTGIGDVCFEAPVTLKDQRDHARPSLSCDLGALERDRVAPTITSSPKVTLRSKVALDGTSMRATVQWAGADNDDGVGIDHFTLQRQVNGGSWSTVATFAGTDGSTNAQRSRSVTLSKDASYRFRVRAVDEDGNPSAYSYSPTITARLVQQSSTSVKFSSGWTTASSTKYSGGSVRYAKANGRSSRYTFTGRGVAFVTTVRQGGTGQAQIWIDGVLQDTISLDNSTTTARYVPFAASFTGSHEHTIRIVTVGSGRVDVDAFAVLK